MLTYFVQVNVCWLLFYGAYFALLSRETFFRLNRIWLITSLLGGLILPLIAPTLEVVEPTNVAAVMLQPIVITASDFSENLQNTEGVAFKILAVIYGLGVAISLGKLFMGFWTIKRLLNRAERLPMDDFTLLQVQEAIVPFSFFRWVFINLNLVQSADLEQIILHEQAHVRERHSFDVVFAELLGVVFWWSPLVYFYTKSLKNVHEYAADEVVLRTSTPPQYGRLLLRQQQSGMSLSLANPFFSQLKKRILMMTRNPSKRRALAKYALAVPIFLVLTLLLASPKTKVMATTEAATDKVVASIETLEESLVNTVLSTDNPSAVEPANDASMPTDGIKVSLEDADGNALLLDDKTLKISKLSKCYDRLKVVQYVNGVLTTLDVEQFSFVSIRNEKVMRVLNNGDKFDTELQQILAIKSPNDWFQIANIRTKQNAPKIAARTWIVENAPPQYLSLSPQEQAAFLKNSDKPLLFLGGKRGGVIKREELLAQDHLEAYQIIDGKAVEVEILSFILFRIPRSADPMQTNNKGGQFNSETKRVIEMAKANDSYQFMEIKCRQKNSTTMLKNAGSEGFLVENISNVTPEQLLQKDLEKIAKTPILTLGNGHKGGAIERKFLANQDRLSAYQVINEKVVEVKIESFVFNKKEAHLGEGGVWTHKIQNSGANFNSEIRNVLKAIKRDEWVNFTEVKGRIEGETELRNLKDLGFYVLEEVLGVIIIDPLKMTALQDSSSPVHTIVDENPLFIGGLDSLFRFLGRNVKYPAEARQLKIEGALFVGFVVEKDGSITNVKIKRNFPESVIDTVKIFGVDGAITGSKIVKRQDYSCANEAVRVIKMMPKWKPGKLKGKPVRVAYTLPIKFKLE